MHASPAVPPHRPVRTSRKTAGRAEVPAARTAAFGELKRIEGPGGTLTRTLTFAGATAREPVSSGELKDPGT